MAWKKLGTFHMKHKCYLRSQTPTPTAPQSSLALQDEPHWHCIGGVGVVGGHLHLPLWLHQPFSPQLASLAHGNSSIHSTVVGLHIHFFVDKLQIPEPTVTPQLWWERHGRPSIHSNGLLDVGEEIVDSVVGGGSVIGLHTHLCILQLTMR